MRLGGDANYPGFVTTVDSPAGTVLVETFTPTGAATDLNSRYRSPAERPRGHRVGMSWLTPVPRLVFAGVVAPGGCGRDRARATW